MRLTFKWPSWVNQIKHKFPLTLLFGVFFCIVLYHFSYLFPFTNNAFVLININPVAANVEGYITKIYVTNEQPVKKGQPLFTVFKKPYELAYVKARFDVAEAKADLTVLKKQVEKTRLLIQAQKENYEKVQFDYKHNLSAASDHAVSKITVNTLLKNKNTAFSNLKALEKELELNQEQIKAQMKRIQSRIAVMHNAKVDLDETTVYAKHNGFVQDMFVALGTPIKIRTPIFTLTDTQTIFIQANFSETDLRNVRTGNKVSIYPRMYFGSKVYHGVVVSRNWAASRLQTHQTSQLEVVKNSADNWFLLPQRLPVQIKITDYDPIDYPLSIGASAYVYIHT